MDKQTDKQTDRQSDRQADRQRINYRTTNLCFGDDLRLGEIATNKKKRYSIILCEKTVLWTQFYVHVLYTTAHTCTNYCMF